MTFTGTLLPYQPEAVDKMVARDSALVAYDMGLGKTVLTIAAIEQLMEEEVITQPGLVIALSGLKFQWAEAIEKFTSGTSTALVIDGTPTERANQYALARDWFNTGVDYIIMNYDQVVNDWDEVKTLPRGFVVLDECNAVKSFRAERSKKVKKLRDAPVRFALTGTPVENGKPEEIFSIFEFVDDSILGNPRSFDQRYIKRNAFGGVERYTNLQELHQKISPAMIRKRQTDPDVAPFLPQVQMDFPIRPKFDQKTIALYRHIKAGLLDDLTELAENGLGSDWNVFSHYGDGPAVFMGSDARGRAMSKMLALQMLCDHPDLLRHSEAEYIQSLVADGWLDNIKSTPKLDALVRYAGAFLDTDPNNKVVIFSRFVEMTDIIATALSKYGTRTFTGRMNAKEKERNKTDFQNRADVRVLVSSDAGGFGVDLPQGNLLINYDLPQTSGSAAQRNSRIIRASSNFNMVVVGHILMRGSIEERQFLALQQKSSVADAIVDGEGTTADGGLDLPLESLTKFLSGKQSL